MTIQSPSDPCEQTPIRVPPRYWWLKRIALGAVLLLVGLAGLRWWWGFEAHRRFQAEIARYRAMGQPVLPEDFVREPIPNEENGAYWLMKAADELDTSMFPADWEWDSATWSYSFGETVVRANTRALELVARAKECEQAEWGLPVITRDPNNSASGVSARVILRAQEQLFQMIAISYEHYMRMNEPLAAIDRLEEGFHQSKLIMKSDNLRFSYQSTWFQRIQVVDLNKYGLDLVDALKGEFLLRECPLRKRLIEVQRSLLEGGLTASITRRWLLIERAEWLFMPFEAYRHDRWSLMPFTPTENAVLRAHKWVHQPYFELNIAAAVSAWEEPMKEAERVGFGSSDATDVAWNKSVHLRAWPLQAHWAKYADYDVLWYARSNLAERRAAALAIALWIYEIDHGNMPSDLRVLVPEYIPEIPFDPFAGDSDGRLWLVNDRWGPRIKNNSVSNDPLDSDLLWLYGRPLMIDAIIDWEQELMNKKALNDDDDAVSDEGQADEDKDRDDEPE